MHLIINNSSMQPIYEQIVGQIKEKIQHGELQQEEALPSVRTLSRELRISALTVKKAYDALEQEGFITSMQGKGSIVLSKNNKLMQEHILSRIEENFENAIELAKKCGISEEILKATLEELLK